MKTINYVIKDSEGIHARPAGVLVKEAKAFDSSVIIKKGEKEADCKKMFGIMSLCVKCGEEITIDIEGSDEEKAAEAIKACVEANL